MIAQRDAIVTSSTIMSGLATAHVIALGFWAGLVAVELVFEVAGLARRLDDRSVALLHRWTDRYLELPTLGVVVGTGLALWARAGWDGALAWKAGAGLAAVTFNLVCYGLVERRCAIESPAEIERFTWRIVRIVSPGFVFAGVALVLGGARAGWW